MTGFEAECLLLGYPCRWSVAREMRQQIIDSQDNGRLCHEGRAQQGQHADSTFKKMVQLDALAQEEAVLEVFREWLTTGLAPEDRILLINLWRGRTLSELDREAGQLGSAWRRFQHMAKSLIRFVGGACGEHGAACANIQQAKPHPES